MCLMWYAGLLTLLLSDEVGPLVLTFMHVIIFKSFVRMPTEQTSVYATQLPDLMHVAAKPQIS